MAPSWQKEYMIQRLKNFVIKWKALSIYLMIQLR